MHRSDSASEMNACLLSVFSTVLTLSGDENFEPLSKAATPSADHCSLTVCNVSLENYLCAYILYVCVHWCEVGFAEGFVR